PCFRRPRAIADPMKPAMPVTRYFAICQWQQPTASSLSAKLWLRCFSCYLQSSSHATKSFTLHLCNTLERRTHSNKSASPPAIGGTFQHDILLVATRKQFCPA